MNEGIVYILENKINKKIYVGQTTNNFTHRMKKHMRGYQYIDRALRKYGIEKFKQLIYKVPENLLDYFEMIKKLNVIHPYRYNLASGGNQNILTRKKMSKAQSGKRHYNYGEELSKEHKKKISISLQRAVVNCDTGQIFKSLIEASAATGCSISRISKVCGGKRKTTKGIHWRYYGN